jgi:hypothetical protein
LPIENRDSLYILRQRIRSCFERNGLKLGNFPRFSAHISLGKFVKNARIKLPKENEFDYFDYEIKLPEQSLWVGSLIFSVREKIQDKKTKKVTYIQGLHQSFTLNAKFKSKAKSAIAASTLRRQKTNAAKLEQEKQCAAIDTRPVPYNAKKPDSGKRANEQKGRKLKKEQAREKSSPAAATGAGQAPIVELTHAGSPG